MIPLPENDDNDEPSGADYRTDIVKILKDHGYKSVSDVALINLNWKLAAVQQRWGDYSKRQALEREVQKSTDALLEFRTAFEKLTTSWQELQRAPAALKLLFNDAVETTGNEDILYAIDGMIDSPELKIILHGLSGFQLRKRLPPASGPIPIAPLVPEVQQLLTGLSISTEPTGFRMSSRPTRSKLSHMKRCGIAAEFLSLINIKFSASAIRNATRP